jgi:hypothetical protein
MSLDGERVMEMACEHLWLTLVQAEGTFGGEGGGAVLATRDGTAVLLAWHDRVRSSPTPFLSNPR